MGSPIVPVAQGVPPPAISDWQWFWETFTQPIATALVGLLVYLFLTERGNRRRLLQQQLEAHAQRRHASLLEQFGAFLGACYDYLGLRDRGSNLDSYRNYLESGADGQYTDAELRERMESLPDQWRELGHQVDVARASLARGYARLRLFDHSETRLATADSLYRRISKNTIRKDDEREALRTELEAFARRIGVELEDQYEHESGLARQAERPIRTITASSS